MLGEDETLLSVGSAYVARSLLRNKSVYKDICIKEKIGSFLWRGVVLLKYEAILTLRSMVQKSLGK
jgi:hypothetical protein